MGRRYAKLFSQGIRQLRKIVAVIVFFELFLAVRIDRDAFRRDDARLLQWLMGDGNGLGMGQRNNVNTRRSDQRRKGQSSSDHFTRAPHWYASRPESRPGAEDNSTPNCHDHKVGHIVCPDLAAEALWAVCARA